MATTEHTAEVQALLQAAGMSPNSELTDKQVERVTKLAAEGTELTGDRLLKAIKGNGTAKKAKAKKYSDEIRAVQAKVKDVCEKGGINLPISPLHIQQVARALGDTAPTEALGLSASALEKYATKGERPKDMEAFKAFVKGHKAIRENANLSPRRVAVVAYAISKQS